MDTITPWMLLLSVSLFWIEKVKLNWTENSSVSPSNPTLLRLSQWYRKLSSLQ